MLWVWAFKGGSEFSRPLGCSGVSSSREAHSLDALRLRQERAACHQDGHVPGRCNGSRHRRIVAPQNLLHPVMGCDETLGHLRGLQVAVTQRKAGDVARDDRRKLESVSANGLILCQDDPSAPTCLAQPLGVRRIVRKVRRVLRRGIQLRATRPRSFYRGSGR